MTEFKILNHIIDFMESTGSSHKLVSITIDQDFADRLNIENSATHTLAELEFAADKCLAHEWLEHGAFGAGKYGYLKITPKGVGAGRSKRKSEEQKASRSRLKKMSDYIEDHKGVFLVLGFSLALATFTLKLFGE